MINDNSAWFSPHLPRERRDPIVLERRDHSVKQEFVIAGLHAEDEVHVQSLQFPNMRRVASQTVFDHDEFQSGVFLTDLAQQPFGGVPFTVVLSTAILLDNRLRTLRMLRGAGITIVPPLPPNVTTKSPTSAPINCTWVWPERARLPTIIFTKC